MSETNFNLSTLDGNNGFIIKGVNDDNLGYSVSNAGDLNGDGIGDIVVGSPLSDPNDKSNSGKTYIIFGRKEGFSKTFDLSTLNGTNGFVINGAGEGDESGRSVSNLGDINGDGVDDLVIGAPFSDINGADSGASYIIFGSKDAKYFSSSIELSKLDPAKGFTIRGSQAGNTAGWSVSSAGDINGDKIKDLIIGVTNSGGNSGPGIKGESYVLFGKSSGFGSGSSFNFSNINPNDGFKIVSNELNNLGYSVSDAGDVNGDGVGDLIIGAPYADPKGNYNAGQSYVIYGRKSDNPFTDNVINVSNLSSSDGFTINGQDSEQAGFFVSKAGDINGDGIGDLIIGARYAISNGQEFAGKSYVVFGKKNGLGSSINLSELNGSNGFTINGIAASDNSGYSVSDVGDINNDDIDDIIIGAPNAKNRTGQSYVIYGNKAGFSKTFELSSLNGDNGFLINGLAIDNDLGISVSGAGDVNGDGVNDLIMSAPFANSQAGAAYVVFGTSVNKAPTGLELSNNNVSVDENLPVNTVIDSLTTIDPNKIDTFTYSLVAGDGDTDNGLFTITDNQLKTNAVFDYEAKNSYTIRIKTTDKGGLSFEKQLTIGVTDVAENEDPTDLALDTSTVAENESSGTAIGTFSTQDPDTENTFIYSLVAGDGDSDNGLFTITDNQLQTNAVFDYEDKNSYSILVQTTDQGGLSVQKQFTIGVTDVNEVPTDLLLDGSTVAENESSGTAVGSFSTQDPDTGNTFTYSLVAGDGDSDNSVFSITDNQLQTNAVFDYEAKNSYSILVQTTDQGGLSAQKQFTIGVTDVNETLGGTDTSDVPLNINSQNNPEKESLDLRSITGAVKAEFVVNREASYNNFVGFYRVTDDNGGIDTNGDGTADILPGEAGYAEAALNGRIPDINLTVGNGETAGFNTTLQGDSIFVPFIIANGTPNTNNPDIYFTFLGANSDGVDHVRMLGNNTFAFEDMRGGGDNDFNDLIVQVKLTPVA